MRSVDQTAPSNRPANRLELNDDGTPRRKYDQEEGEDSRVVVRTTIGLVLVNAFVLVKNVLFSGDPAQAGTAHGAGGGREQGQQTAQQAAGAEELSAEEPDEQGDGIDKDLDDDAMPGHIGSGSSIGLFSSPAVNVDPDLAPIYFRGSGHIASSNDNESLYGARPGRGIGLSGDSIALTHGGGHSGHAGGGGHGGGSGGGPGHGEDPDGSGHGPDNDDDEEDDETHGPGPGSTNPDPPRQPNRLPVVLGPVILASLFANEARAITPGELLAHASDPDGDMLSVRNLQASSGTLVQKPDGSWMFTPDPDDTSSVVFTYRIGDGQGTTAQTASLDLVPRPAPPAPHSTGSSGSDILIGTPGHDVIDGLGGNDIIYGREGNDVLIGGDGDDRILGGDGDDVIFGGAGNDVIYGGRGNDTIDAGAGDDFVDGEEGKDVVIGGDGNDTLLGGGDNDAVSGDGGNDKVYGGDGHDVADGGAGDDDVDGGSGNDVTRGGTGNDHVAGGSGDDTVIGETDDGDDIYDGGSGTDTYNMASTSADASVDLTAGTASSAETGSDTLTGIENVTTGAGDDTVTGDGADNVVDTGAGDDTVALAGGDDTVIATAGDGDDSYDGGSGSDTYDASSTTAGATIDLAAATASSADIGSDTIANFENVCTGSGDDVITGSDAANTVSAGGGSDTVDMGAGDDTVIATSGDGDDTYTGGSGADTYDMSTTTADALIDLISESVTSADVGRDIIVSFENVSGGKGNDTLIANDARNIFIGGEGNDRFEFHSSAAIGYGQGHRDQILDFAIGDSIDIDKVRNEFADDLSDSFGDKHIEKFVILSDPAAVFSQPGELKLQYASLDGHDVTIIEGNTDYDAAAEFELELAGTYVLTEHDFYRA